MKIEQFEDIKAWQLARELTRKVYRLTKKPGFAKDYGLKKQIQNAAGSSTRNTAEGFDSETNPEFIRFLRYAKRSCTEVQSELYVALDEELGYPNRKTLEGFSFDLQAIFPYIIRSVGLGNQSPIQAPN